METETPPTIQEAKDKGYTLYQYRNGDYKYTDSNRKEHLIRDGYEIAHGDFVWSYDNGAYEFEENGIEQRFSNNGTELYI